MIWKRTFLRALVAAGSLAILSQRAVAQDETAAVRKTAADFSAAWNRHDAKAMADMFVEDGDIINPFGRVAKGRAEVEKLFQDEHATVMKGTTFNLTKVEVRMLGAGTAVVDWEVELVGMHGPAGAALPPLKHHVAVVEVKKGDRWLAAAVRPYVFAAPPGSSE